MLKSEFWVVFKQHIPVEFKGASGGALGGISALSVGSSRLRGSEWPGSSKNGGEKGKSLEGEGRNGALRVTKKQPHFIKVSSSCYSNTMDMFHLNIFYKTFVKDPLFYVCILFLQGIWVMVGL